MPEGDSYVTDGALLRCDKGTLPTPLTVVPPRASRVHGRMQATTVDCLPLVNVKPFGVCAITHGPCLPPALVWTQAHPGGRLVGGALPLLESSVCQCALGGRIAVTVLPVPVGGLAGVAAGIAADWRQQERDAHDPHASEEVKSHALSGRLQLLSAGAAVVGLGCAVAGFFFPPLAAVGAAVLAVSEVLFVAAVAIDVIVAVRHPTKDNWVRVGQDALAVAIGYAVGKVLLGPALKAMQKGARQLLEREAAEVPVLLPKTGQAVDEAAAAARAARRQDTQSRWMARAETRQRAQALDNDGGHSYADHGAQTTAAQQTHRLRTGEAPSGRTPTYNRGPRRGQAQIPSEASKFDSHAKHVEAAQKAEVAMQANRTNPDGSLKSVVVVEVLVQNAGTSYHLDSNGNVVNQTANTAKAVYRLDPVTNTYKLVTLYPQP